MGIALSSLSPKLGVNVASTDIFLVSNSNSSSDNKITRDQLSQAFTGFTAQNSNGISLFESAGAFGLSVSGSNGFVGINNRTPYVTFDIVDNTASTNGSGQMRISTTDVGRKIGISITDPNTYYQFSKKSNDTKLYLESSVDGGANFTNLMAFDQSGNVAIHEATGSLTRKFLVSGQYSEFQYGGNSIIFDPFNGEIKTNASDETLLLNYNNFGDIKIGYNALFIDNDLASPKVGVNTSTPTATFNVSGSGITTRLESNTTSSVIGLGNIVDSGFYGVVNDKTFFGPFFGESNSNVTYHHTSEGFLGLGNSSPQYKLDVVTNALPTAAHFSNTGTAKTCEIIVAANKALGGGDTGPRNSFLTFSRYDGAVDVDKWSIGNIYQDNTFLGNDDFVFIKNGYFGSSPDVVAKLSPIGDFDIDGNYTSDGGYCKGHFIEVYSSSLTGTSNVYIDPFGVYGSSPVSSGNFNNDAPFGISMYNGKLERAMFMTSNNISPTNAVFQFYSITPVSTSVNNYNNIGTTGDIANVKCSGTITLNPNQISQLVFSSSFAGLFTSGQLLQFRLMKTDYTTLDIPVKITSAIKYRVI